MTEQAATASIPAVSRAMMARVGVLAPSLFAVDETMVGLRLDRDAWELVTWTPAGGSPLDGIGGTSSELDGGTMTIAPADDEHAAVLRRHVTWLRPTAVGQRRSIGLGDRLGMAAPGHIRALRAHPGVTPVLAQQSARELARCGRTFPDVLTAATFGALAEGWTAGYGADADHLKTIDDIAAAVRAGYTTITVDPVEFVPAIAADASDAELATAFQRVPWAALEDNEATLHARYPDRLDTDLGPINIPADALRSAAARFGPAVVRLVMLARHLAAVADPTLVELEVAVDEIAHPTTAVDHIYLATELGRLGVRWAAFAPHFVGTFEKGAEYQGDIAAFEVDLARHAAIARRLGPYKISIHSGSDKYSVYPTAIRATSGLMHLKTSGTSYLAALQTIAAVDPALIRRVWGIAIDAYALGRASYHVSADPASAPRFHSIPDNELPALFDRRDVREILHVTYGSMIGPGVSGVREAVLDAIRSRPARYSEALGDHIGRHLALLAVAAPVERHGGLEGSTRDPTSDPGHDTCGPDAGQHPDRAGVRRAGSTGRR